MTAGTVKVHPRLKSIEKQDLPTKTLEAEQILEENPGVATVSRFLGQRASDHDRFATFPDHYGNFRRIQKLPRPP
jgi:hypothetical protein